MWRSFQVIIFVTTWAAIKGWPGSPGMFQNFDWSRRVSTGQNLSACQMDAQIWIWVYVLTYLGQFLSSTYCPAGGTKCAATPYYQIYFMYASTFWHARAPSDLWPCASNVVCMCRITNVCLNTSVFCCNKPGMLTASCAAFLSRFTLNIHHELQMIYLMIQTSCKGLWQTFTSV